MEQRCNNGNYERGSEGVCAMCKERIYYDGQYWVHFDGVPDRIWHQALPNESDEDDLPTDGAVTVDGIGVTICAGDDMAEVAAMLAAMLDDKDMADLIFRLQQQRAITKAMRLGAEVSR